MLHNNALLFGNSKIRADSVASECLEPLISLMQSSSETTIESGIFAFERWLEDEHQAELATAFNVVDLLVKYRVQFPSSILTFLLEEIGNDCNNICDQGCHVSFVDKVYDVECESNHDNGPVCEHGVWRGSSKLVSMCSQKGTKGVNQDALTVWEDFTGEKGMTFCGVFDGHGPLGHKFAQYTRDNLPSKLSAAIKLSQQQKVLKHYDSNATYTGINGEDNQNMSFASWEGSFVRSFKEMDEDLARNIDTNYSGGSTAVTVIKRGDQLIVGNLGDSRAVLCTRGDDDQLIPVQLTVDFTPDIPSEASRIINCGGRVFAAEEDPGINRLWMPEDNCPGLAMSRAFGDFCLKDYGLTSVPDVSSRKLTKKDEFVVLATDGVWDVLTNNEVIKLVASAPNRSIAAKLLVKRATWAWKIKYPRFKVDDIAVICFFLNDLPVSTHYQSNVSGDN
ncbi:probable protein phosphatase 2C 65 [Gastrolobium bilobum]|uniref:probable protein phosphatase 2C 65 n=1 Tax=Gastrolobium bilobum TaxID=150636 RepID=UPI002AB14BDC|nr:probable protein phosphatase 2C 65 [Gastrolobium bilobum]